MKANILITQTVEIFAQQAATFLADSMAKKEQPAILTGLSGGSTPYPVYRLLAPLLAKQQLSEKCFWIQTDERIVGADDPRSNQKAIKESLFAGGFLAAKNFIAAPVAGPVDKICHEYHYLCSSQLPTSVAPPAPIDILILGSGTDGHIASLFPDTNWQESDPDLFYKLVKSSSQPELRLSLSLRALLQAKEVVFLVNGSGKQAILEEIFLDEGSNCPAAYLNRKRQTQWIIAPDAVSARLADFFQL